MYIIMESWRGEGQTMLAAPPVHRPIAFGARAAFLIKYCTLINISLYFDNILLLYPCLVFNLPVFLKQ